MQKRKYRIEGTRRCKQECNMVIEARNPYEALRKYELADKEWDHTYPEGGVSSIYICDYYEDDNE